MYGMKPEQFYKIIKIIDKYSSHISWVKIFGSRARSDYKNYSDIDLALSTFEPNVEVKIAAEMEESSIPFKFDIVNYDKLTNEKLKKYIDEEGRLIFSKTEEGKNKMRQYKINDKYENFDSALEKLESIMKKDILSDDAYLDAAIKRFEFTYEIAWKLIKGYLEYLGINNTEGSRNTFREAFKAGVIDKSELWMKMIDDRNKTSHTYDESSAMEIYNKIKIDYLDLLIEFKKEIKERIDAIE